MNGQTVAMVPNQRAVFAGLPSGGQYEVTADAAAANVVAVSAPGAEVLGVAALAPGVAEVTVVDVSAAPAQPVLTVTVEVAIDGQSGGMVGGDPATWTPVEVTPEMNGQTVEMAIGQAGLFRGFDSAGLVVVSSSDMAVVVPLQPSDDGTVQTAAGFQAVAAGTATVTVSAANAAPGAAPLVSVTVTVAP